MIIDIPYGMISSFYTALESAAGGSIQANPTIAAGDVIIYSDNDAGNNLDTLPSALGVTAAIKVEISAAEATTKQGLVIFQDASGAEWLPKLLTFQTKPPELLGIAVQGLAQGCTGNSTLTLEAGTIINDDDYAGCRIELIKGTGIGQVSTIVSSIASTQIITVSPEWGVTPTTPTYNIYLKGVTSVYPEVSVQQWLGTTVATPDTAGYPKTTIKDGTGTGEIGYLIEELLNYDFTGLTDTNQRTILNSLRRLINKVAISGSVLTVYKEDDATSAFTQNITTSTTAGAIISVDTV